MSRDNARSRSLRSRPSRTVPATIVALVLLVLGVLLAYLAISRLTSGRWAPAATSAASGVAALTWGSAAVVVVGVVTALVGLVLLVAGLKPGRFQAAPLSARSSSDAVADTDFVISGRSLARLAAARADQVDGVGSVSASASGGRVHLSVKTVSEQTAQIRQQVQDGVTERLAQTGVRSVPRVSTTVRTEGI